MPERVLSGRRHDRGMLRLALPARGALAAEPTYILVMTGHAP